MSKELLQTAKSQQLRAILIVVTIICVLLAIAYCVKCRMGIDFISERHLGIFRG